MSQQATFDQASSFPNLAALLSQLTDAERAELAAGPAMSALRLQLTVTEALAQQSRTAQKLTEVRTAVDRLWAGMPLRLRRKYQTN